jgi:hypothetical protein
MTEYIAFLCSLKLLLAQGPELSLQALFTRGSVQRLERTPGVTGAQNGKMTSPKLPS